ncbi:hypothetical protein ACWEKR_31190 [Nocardia sp. NPDC004573]
MLAALPQFGFFRQNKLKNRCRILAAGEFGHEDAGDADLTGSTYELADHCPDAVT